MRHQDLGVMDEDVFLFGGPYSNVQALNAFFEVAGSCLTICTGDVVAYCGAPVASIEMMRNRRCPVVAGNCEIQLGNGADDCGCGFEQGTTCDLLSGSWYAFAQSKIRKRDRAWMAGLPDILSFKHFGQRYAVIHGGLTDVARFIWPTSDPAIFEEEWDAIEGVIGTVDHVVAGHCGLPFAKQTNRGRWINPGVIGMPSNNGKQTTSYARLTNAVAVFEELSYDVASAARDMETAGLPAGYREGLVSGYWPSEDVLPPELRVSSKARG